MTKLTNVLALEMVLGMKEVQANVELVEKLTKMKEQFEKKNKSSVGADGKKVLTAEQKKNEGLKETILEVLTRYEEPKQIKELIAENEELASYTGQKISALITQLLKAEKVVKVVDKNVSKFQLA
jgi:hypothetical protein